MNEKPKKSSFFVRRFVKTVGHSAAGLAFAWRSEEAFRVEILLCVALIPAAFLVDPSALGRLLLVGSLLLVVIVELLNTALEKTVDRISTERHQLSKTIKDLGSAAVSLTLILALLVWLTLLI